MLIPIRCFTCGKPVGDKYAAYQKELSEGKKAPEAFEDLGIDRFCCKRMFVGQADLAEEIKKYPRF